MKYEEFIKSNERLIHKLAHKYHIDNYEHCDLYQEGLTKLWEVFDNYNDNYKPTTFITVVLNNHYKNLLTSSKTQTRCNYIEGVEYGDVYDYDWELLEDSEDNINENADSALSHAFELLSGHKYQEVIELVLKGHTYEQVGNYYGVSKQRIHQIYDQFIKEIKKESEDLK